MGEDKLGNWYVFDSSPPDSLHAKLYGPFESVSQAYEYANLQHPDDESGNTLVLKVTAP